VAGRAGSRICVAPETKRFCIESGLKSSSHGQTVTQPVALVIRLPKNAAWSGFIGTNQAAPTARGELSSNPTATLDRGTDGRTADGRTGEGWPMTTIGNLLGTRAYFSPTSLPVTHFLIRPPRLVWLPNNNLTQKRSGNETRKYGTLRINPFSALTSFFADAEKGIHQRPNSTILNLKNQFSNLTFKSSGGPLNRPRHNLQHQHYQSRKKNPSE